MLHVFINFVHFIILSNFQFYSNEDLIIKNWDEETRGIDWTLLIKIWIEAVRMLFRNRILKRWMLSFLNAKAKNLQLLIINNNIVPSISNSKDVLKVYINEIHPRVLASDGNHIVQLQFSKEWLEELKKKNPYFSHNSLYEKFVLLMKWKFNI